MKNSSTVLKYTIYNWGGQELALKCDYPTISEGGRVGSPTLNSTVESLFTAPCCPAHAALGLAMLGSRRTELRFLALPLPLPLKLRLFNILFRPYLRAVRDALLSVLSVLSWLWDLLRLATNALFADLAILARGAGSQEGRRRAGSAGTINR